MCLGVAGLAALVAQLLVWALPGGLWGAILTGVLAWRWSPRARPAHVARVLRPLAGVCKGRGMRWR